MIIGALMFLACTWAVFTKHIKDDLIGRHLLVFAAISSAGFAWSGEPRAFFTAYVLALSFILWHTLVNYVRVVLETSPRT